MRYVTKAYSFILFLCLCCGPVSAQDLVMASGYVGKEEVQIQRLSASRFLYPVSAQRRGIEGNVTIEYVVGIDGRVASAHIVESKPPGRFDKSALDYVNSFVFKPHRQNGTPVEVKGIIAEIPFRLR